MLLTTAVIPQWALTSLGGRWSACKPAGSGIIAAVAWFSTVCSSVGNISSLRGRRMFGGTAHTAEAVVARKLA